MKIDATGPTGFVAISTKQGHKFAINETLKQMSVIKSDGGIQKYDFEELFSRKNFLTPRVEKAQIEPVLSKIEHVHEPSLYGLTVPMHEKINEVINQLNKIIDILNRRESNE